jgi:hypothetical protein
VSPKTKLWLGIAALAIAAGGFAGVQGYRSRPLGPSAMLARLPQSDAVVFYADFEALRSGGVLQMLDSGKAEDPDYREFARKIGLDWRRDLDRAMLAIAPSGKFILAQGRFDWPRLRAYAAQQGGECRSGMCRLNGSTPERRISFLPLQSNLMALAVSTDEWAVRTLASVPPASPSEPDAAAEPPAAPVWLKIPSSALRSPSGLPDGTRMFARSMAQADYAVLSLQPDGQRLAARLDVHCESAKDAADIAGELSHATSLLREMIARERQTPNPADLSGVLSSGNFWSQGTRVYGNWPIERAFLQNLLGGA